MNLLLVVFILAGTVIPMEEQQEYYVVCFEDNTCVEYATREEVVSYLKIGEFVYFPEGPAKGYNYKKHNRKLKIHRWIDRKFRHNICDQYPN